MRSTILKRRLLSQVQKTIKKQPLLPRLYLHRRFPNLSILLQVTNYPYSFQLSKVKFDSNSCNGKPSGFVTFTLPPFLKCSVSSSLISFSIGISLEIGISQISE